MSLTEKVDKRAHILAIAEQLFAEKGFDVVAIDIATSDYVSTRVFPIIEYDGKSIPLPDSSVDVLP